MRRTRAGEGACENMFPLMAGGGACVRLLEGQGGGAVWAQSVGSTTLNACK